MDAVDRAGPSDAALRTPEGYVRAPIRICFAQARSGRRGRHLEGAGGTPSRAARGRSGLRSGQRRDVLPHQVSRVEVSTVGRSSVAASAAPICVRFASRASCPRAAGSSRCRCREPGVWPMASVGASAIRCWIYGRAANFGGRWSASDEEKGKGPGGDRYEQGPEVAELGRDLPAETKSAKP